MSRLDDTTIPWPVGRIYHSSCLLAGPLTGHQHPVVVMMAGRDNNTGTLSDLWIMKREQTWKKVCLGIMNNMYIYVGVNYVVSNTMYVHIHVHVGYRFLSTTLAYLGL